MNKAFIFTLSQKNKKVSSCEYKTARFPDTNRNFEIIASFWHADNSSRNAVFPVQIILEKPLFP